MSTSASERTEGLFAHIDALGESLEGQLVVSQNRWVDHLLDLFNLVEGASLRTVVASALDAIRLVDSVETAWLRDQLATLAAAAEVESAFDAVAALG